MRNSNGRIIVGVILILIGVFYFADNFFFFPFQIRHILFSWPTILVVIGIVFLVTNRDSHTGLILIVIGGAFLITRYYNMSLGEVLREYWPVLLIIFGLMILLKPRKQVNYNDKFEHKLFDEADNEKFKQTFHKSKYDEKKDKDFVDNSSEIINESIVFNHIDRRIYTPNFKGGKVTAVFGGADIDLRNAKLAEGRQVLNIEVVFGGINIYVPRDWKVVISVTSIFGAFDDQRRPASDATQDDSKVLEIKGSVVFGGGDLKN